ncbi:hypothetical protein Esti_002337 [Eimeria stiedai]
MKGTAQCIVRGSYCGRQLVVTALSESSGSAAARYSPHCKVQPFHAASVKARGRNSFVSVPALALPLRDPRLRCRIGGPFIPRLIACRRQQGGREVHSTSAAKGLALAISAELRDGLHRLGVRKLTAMQRLSLLKTLRGCNLAVAAKPGAGKTLAYLLPVLQQFASEEASQEMAFAPDDASLPVPFALLLLPSRELARQVMAVATALLPRAPILLLDSTTPLRQHQQMLAHLSPRLFVATPDRVLSLLQQKSRRTATSAAGAPEGAPVQAELCLEKLHFLVVDEADALLRQGYMSKVKAIYQAAMGKKTSSKHLSDLEAQKSQPKQDSPQVLFFTAVLTRELHAVIDSNFPDVEALDFATSVHGQGSKGTYLTRDDEHKLKDNSTKKCSSHGEHNSATVGAGVEQHICYVAAPNVSTISSGSEAKAFDDLQQTKDPALRRLNTKRSKLTDEEAQIDRERKMLALAEILRTYIPTLTFEGRRGFDKLSNQAERRTASCLTDAKIDGDSSSSGSEGSPSKSGSDVRYIAQHPLLDGWTIAFVHSDMETTERQHAMQAFVEGAVSVLVCTDVAARGLDIPAVVLVVHVHPPTPAINYIHRSGRAGRGHAKGISVVLCSESEKHRLPELERVANFRFERRALPAITDCPELLLKQLTADMLNVPPARYAPLLDLARRLHAKVGVNALATTLLKLGGPASVSTSVLCTPDCQSVLSGRRGFTPLLLYDPTHQRFESSMEARRFLLSLLPRGASVEGVGRLVKSAKGFVADVSTTYADHVIQGAIHKEKAFREALDSQDVHDGGSTVASKCWVPVFPLERLPRLLNPGIGRRKRGARLPWSKLRRVTPLMGILSASPHSMQDDGRCLGKIVHSRLKQQALQGAASKECVLKGATVRVQAMEDANTQHTMKRA